MGGSQTHDKITWLVSAQLGSQHRMYGSVGAKVMEWFQTFHHLRYGTYVIYSPSHKIPKIAFLLGLADKGIRQTGGKFLKDAVFHPKRLFQPLYVQSIGIIQGPDLLEDGRIDMCESCPDMTVWDGQLVHSCRLDEWRLYGNYVTARPRQADTVETAVQPAEPIIMRDDIAVTGD
jgi:hypothetical protein